MKLYSLLEQKTGGGLALTGDEKIQDFNDDNFPDREFKIKRTRIGTDGSILDTVNIRIQKEKDRSGEPLFATEPAISDIKQGYLGDCYFLSALNALMFKDPQLIKNCMKDEGETVVVRFFAMSTGRPVYVRVRKTVPVHKFKGKNRQGNDVTSVEEIYGNKGPLWVNMMEKAFAAARHQLDIYCESGEFRRNPKKNEKGYGVLDFGLASNAIRILTGTQMEMKLLPGLQGRKKYTDISALFSQVHYAEKDDFMRGRRADGSKRTASDWNRYKAEKIFGIRIGEGDGRLLNIFRKNRVFDAYQRFLSDHLKRNFNSLGNKEAKPGFSTMTDLNLFIESIDISQMPTLNLGAGIDEAQVKRHYLEYFRSTIATSGFLSNGINTNGKYSEEEKKIFRDLTKNLVTKDMKKRAVTASTARHGLSFKSGSALVGGSGEMLVDGVADSHVYSILGTRTRDVTVNGKTVKLHFVILHNPWNDSKVRLYEHDTMKPYMAAEGTDAKGTFLMELSDFCNTFQEYSVEKEGAYKEKATSRLVEDDRPDFEAAVDMTDDDRITKSVRDMKQFNADLRKMLEDIKGTPDYAQYTQGTRDIIDGYLHMIADDTPASLRNEDGAKILPVLKDVWARKNSLQDTGENSVLLRLASILLPLSTGDLRLTGKEKITDHSTEDKVYFAATKQMNTTEMAGGEQIKVIKQEIITDDPKCDCTAQPLFATEPSAAMKDEGSTVVVRFYDHKSLEPVYVRVKKSLEMSRFTYVDSKGNTLTHDRRKGAKGALWVNILEKAFAYVRHDLHDPGMFNKSKRGYDAIDGGFPADFARIFIGKKFKETKLKGDRFDSRDYHDLDSMIDDAKSLLKARFMNKLNNDGSKRTARDWNIFKAKYIFGIDIPSGNTKLYDMFRKNTITDKYNSFIKEQLKDFKSMGHGQSEAPGFVTTVDLDLFLDSIDLNRMPLLGLDSGYDEMELRKRYIEHLRKSIKALNKTLSGNVNMDDEYQPAEDAVFRELQSATSHTGGKRKTVIASIRGATLQKLKKKAGDTGSNGEAKIIGVAAGHSYVIGGVTTKDVTIGGRKLTRKFIEVHNPWHNNYIRLYDKDTLRPFVRKSERRSDGTKYDNKGMFLMETFQGYNIEE